MFPLIFACQGLSYAKARRGWGVGGGGKLRKKALGNDFVDPCFLSFVDRIPWKIEENVATVFFT